MNTLYTLLCIFAEFGGSQNPFPASAHPIGRALDRHGKVSRQEYMKFMAAEFDRLDKANSGELDVKVLTQSNLSVSRFVGK